MENDIQAQNIPVDIDYNNSDRALRQLVEVAKQQVIRINELEKKIELLEEVVHGI